MTHNTLYLREKDKLAILAIQAKYLPTITIWAYGSRVNGTAHDTSDLNLVLRTPDLTPIPLIALDEFISALKESNIPILIEARDWARLPASFHAEILKNYVILN